MRPSKKALTKHNIDAETTQLPVLVWIHGGGFADGAATDPVWGKTLPVQIIYMKHSLTKRLHTDPSRIVLRAHSKKTPLITVSINYRLNIFGFGGSSDILSAQDSHGSPRGVNFGLYDQKLALIWIKYNISAFGGDGTKVAIMGHSAGGICCHLHLLEAELGTNEPLFRKAALMSGSCGDLDLTSLDKADQRWADLYQLWSVQADNELIDSTC